LAGERCIAPSVGLEGVPAIVELATVDLDDQPPGDREVGAEGRKPPLQLGLEPGLSRPPSRTARTSSGRASGRA
jgi:hypothetical protein